MTFTMIRRSLAAIAVLAAIAAPSAMACSGAYTPPPTGAPGTPCAKASTHAFQGGQHHRGRAGRNCTPTPPPPVTPPVDPPPVDPGPSL